MYVSLYHMSCDPITVSIVTDGKHKAVPQEIFQEAEQYAKVGTLSFVYALCHESSVVNGLIFMSA